MAGWVAGWFSMQGYQIVQWSVFTVGAVSFGNEVIGFFLCCRNFEKFF